MENFEFQNSTKIIFGRGVEERVGVEVAKFGKKILLHFGGGSIKTSGLYEKVVFSLKKAGVSWVELDGVKPNPRLALVREGIRLCREQKLGLVLAVGGGSVIDSAKAIAMGTVASCDVWDFFLGKVEPITVLPVATVLTIPAAGSESSTATVITNEEGWLKRGYNHELLYPKVSFLNPELAFTLPKNQVACGAVDILSHLLERYFTNIKHVSFTDRLLEATMKTVIQQAPLVLANPKDYDAWSELMWAGTVAHNNLLNTGRIGDWASHDIEHELSAVYDVAHGAGLAVIFPAWMSQVLHQDLDRFLQWSVRVWNVELDIFNPEAVALEGIARFKTFIHSLGLGTRLIDLGIKDDRIDEMASKCTAGNSRTIGNFVKLDRDAVRQIYLHARGERSE